MRNIIIGTGGAGFVGSNLIELLLKKTSDRVISLDDYSVGIKKNHINNSRVNYLKGNTLDFFNYFNNNSNNDIIIKEYCEVISGKNPPTHCA